MSSRGGKALIKVIIIVRGNILAIEYQKNNFDNVEFTGTAKTKTPLPQ